jgi:hypothetical protein
MMNDETGDLEDTMQVRCLDLPPAQSVLIVDDDDLGRELKRAQRTLSNSQAMALAA